MAGTEALFQRYGQRYRWYVLITLTLGTLTAIMSSTIANVAIPAIMTEFTIKQDTAHWVTTGFLASVPIGMLLAGSMVERWGIRRVLVASLLLFIFTSLLAAQSSYFSALITYRVLQGIAAGVVQPLSVITIFQVFPVHQRGFAVGIYGFGAVLGPASAPVLGGLFVDWWSWPSIFILPLPLVAIAVVMSHAFMPSQENTQQRPISFDWVGLLFLLLIWVAHLWWLTEGLHFPATTQLGFMGLFLLAMGLFVRHQLTVESPLLALAVFRYPLFAMGFILSVLLGIGLFASTYVAALFFQQVLLKSAAQAGLMLLPAGGIMALVFPLAGYLSDRWPFYRLIILGMVMFAVSMLTMAYTPLGAALWLWMLWIMIGRVALGILTPPLGTVPLQYMPADMLSQAAGIITFARQWGAVLGVAGSAIVVQVFAEASPYWADPDKQVLAYQQGFYAAFMALVIINVAGLLLCFYTMKKWPQQPFTTEGIE